MVAERDGRRRVVAVEGGKLAPGTENAKGFRDGATGLRDATERRVEHDHVERSVLERQRAGVGHLEADVVAARGQFPRFLE